MIEFENKLKILLANYSLDKIGGTESYTFAFAEELKKRGHEVEYFCFVKGLMAERLENELGLTFQSKKKYDIIFANHIVCVQKLWRYGFIIQTCHGIFIGLESPSIFADMIVSISKEVQNKLKTENFENIVSETDLKRQSEFGESFHDDFDGLRILTLGRLAVEKGQQLVPNVVRRLKDDGLNFRWYLIGEGNLRKELEKEIKRLRIENELVLLGSKINPYSYLKDCDLYVQTSLHEGYCITLYEAKIFEKPVVTTDFLSASNLIENHGDGLIVEISENGIYAAVKELIKDDNKRKEFSSFLKKPESRNEQKIQKYFYLIK